MIAGDRGDARLCLGRKAPGTDLPESNYATKARTGDTEVISAAFLTPPQS